MIRDCENRNQNLSHITTGTIYNPPSTLTVLVNEAYYTHSGSSVTEGGGGDGNQGGLFLASSRFNYANLSADGSMAYNVLNTWSTPLTATGEATEPVKEVRRGYAVSNFPLFMSDILRENSAVFGGLVDDRNLFGDGDVASVSLVSLSSFPRASLSL